MNKKELDENLLKTSIDGDLKEVKDLIEKGICVNSPTNGVGELTPLHFASRLGHLDIVELLIEKGADIHGKDPEESTPLHGAALCGHVEVAKLLIKHGAARDQCNKWGRRHSA